MSQTLLGLLLTIFWCTFFLQYDTCRASLQDDISHQLERRNGSHLNRKRRYLLFPAGSSFQLVFCLTYPSVAVGSYFVFGNTAALAWELPSTREFFDEALGKKKEEVTTTTTTTTTTEIPHDIDFSQLDHHKLSKGDYFYDHPYQSNKEKIEADFSKWSSYGYNRNPVSTYTNPFFPPSSSYYSSWKDNDWTNPGNYRRNGYYSERRKNYGQSRNIFRYDNRKLQSGSYVDPTHYHIHRRTRRELYLKLEHFFTALNVDGKACLLKAICEVNRSSKEKGSFVEEIIKTLFRVKPHDDYPDEDHYDRAANVSHDCDQVYPSCKGSVWTNLFLFQK